MKTVLEIEPNTQQAQQFIEYARILPFIKIVTEAKNDTVRNVARFKGILTEEEAHNYHQYLQKSRQEWDRGI